MNNLIKQLLNNKVVRYFFSAGTATIVDVTTYFCTFNYLLHKQDIPLIGKLVITAPIASLIVSYNCGLFTNFFITKYLVFSDSNLRGRHQLFRFAQVAMVVLCLNYLFMKFLIVILGWFPTIARIVSALTIGLVSYMSHKKYSFGNKKE